MIRVCLMLCALFLPICTVYGQTYPALQALVSASTAQTLQQEELVFQYGSDDSCYLDTFLEGDLKADLTATVQRIQANYFVQILYFLPKDTLPEQSDVSIYNAIKDVESLENSYVLRHGRHDPFFTKVQQYCDDSFKTKAAFKPLSAQPIPAESIVYMQAKDTRFGYLNYAVQYRYKAGRFTISMLNLEPVSYMMHTIASAQKFTTIFTAQPVREGILYVANVFALIKNLPAAEKRIDLRTFFSRRLEAVKGWYFRQVHHVEVYQGILPKPIKIEM